MYRSIARILSILVLTASTLQAQVVISEFRVRGPNGGSDEFIELLNVSAVMVARVPVPAELFEQRKRRR
ncbi:MAG TPA: hypothetical protein VKH35_16095 [Thermoanaerobaculia bacterium]|nr:hypothetical protein [Thermoanaerobaculia bacterium]